MRKIYMYVLHILAYVTCKSVQRLEFEKTRLQCEKLGAGRGAKNFFCAPVYYLICFAFPEYTAKKIYVYILFMWELDFFIIKRTI